jgi:hypothetical protein
MPTISFGINIRIAFHKTSPKEHCVLVFQGQKQPGSLRIKHVMPKLVLSARLVPLIWSFHKIKAYNMWIDEALQVANRISYTNFCVFVS